MPAKVIIVSAFALMIIIIGILGMRRTRSFSDYFLGGGTVGPYMTAFTYGAAYFSAVLFIGFAGKVGWDFGLSGLWVGIGNAFVGVLAVWWVGSRQAMPLEVAEGSFLPEVAHERVRASVVLSLDVDVPGGGVVRVALRKAADGTLSTQAIPGRGARLTDPEVAAAVERARAWLRDEAGLPPGT